MPNLMTYQEDGSSIWQQLPDSILFHMFSYLQPQELLCSARVCKAWCRVAMDDYLWKDLLYRVWNIDRSIPRVPGKATWLGEFKRLYYHTPKVESEVLCEHRDQVLHVSFSHDGDLFATSSKDGFVKVWNSGYPATVKYYADMKEFTWKYTQFSQFNESDTHLLVSGVHFGSHSTSGEIAVFNLIGGFELQCRVLNKPYDIFGTWYSESYLLSGNLYWLGHLTSCSVLWLNKASQALESEHENVVMKLYRFRNINASSIRTIMIAQCLDSSDGRPDVSESRKRKGSEGATIDGSETSHFECSWGKLRRHSKRRANGGRQLHLMEVDEGADTTATIEYNVEYRRAQSLATEQGGVLSSCGIPSSSSSTSRINQSLSDSCLHSRPTELPHLQASGTFSMQPVAGSSMQIPPQGGATRDKYLIFTTGMKTYTPHQIGIKRIKAQEAVKKMNAPASPGAAPDLPGANAGLLVANEEPAGNEAPNEFDTVDHLIELHGHIIGMCLSPDHRYLYVNSRPWPQGYRIEDALLPPPIAQEIDIHVIDLLTMDEVGTMHRAHKAYTPNDECFFIFLDVCDEYVASGAEDKHGYLWDRHYGVCLTKFPHSDVVNSIAFNPRDPEMLITSSDDHSLKIWRSRHKEKQVKGQHTVV